MFKFILTFLWGLPQNILAITIMSFLGVEFPFRFYKQAVIFPMSYSGGLTLGNFIFINCDYQYYGPLLSHELGHVRQSRILGPLYLIVIGLPSLLWAALRSHIAPSKPQSWFYTEHILM